MQLVGLYNDILRILYEQNRETSMGVNEIYKHTGSRDKPRVLKSLKYLEKIGLIESKNSETHVQKIIKGLTDLGCELAELSVQLDNFTQTYLNLKQSVRFNFPISAGSYNDLSIADKNKLIFRGWRKEEIEKYIRHSDDSHWLIRKLWQSALDFLITKYGSILHRFGLKKGAEDFLKQIIIDWISQHITNLNLEDYQNNPLCDSEIDWEKGDVGILLYNELFRDVFDTRYYRYNRFIETHAERALLTIGRLPNYSKENLLSLIEEARSEITGLHQLGAVDPAELRELENRIKILEKVSNKSI